MGYARCSTHGQELDSQLDALAAENIPRDKIFAEKISTQVRVRPQVEAAPAAALEIKAHAAHCRVILTGFPMRRTPASGSPRRSHTRTGARGAPSSTTISWDRGTCTCTCARWTAPVVTRTQGTSPGTPVPSTSPVPSARP
ncbi:recombinase family protein [Streptomyces spinosus]|uniref:recombinase family protein n=1 Tax=Streptomyces spinosus TaxID=2872623 RepID=UPI001CEDA247|nr:recombinase family protein [Streptomyces spinosus]